MNTVLLGLLAILVIVAGFLLSQLLGSTIDRRRAAKNSDKTNADQNK